VFFYIDLIYSHSLNVGRTRVEALHICGAFWLAWVNLNSPYTVRHSRVLVILKRIDLAHFAPLLVLYPLISLGLLTKK